MIRKLIRRMKLLNTRTSSADDQHQDVWELIPWFVNGSMPSGQKKMVQAHIKTCPECATEIARQHKLAKHVATADPFDAPVSRSWETLRGQIAAEAPAVRQGGFDLWRWLSDFKTGLIATGVGVAACLLVVVMILPNGQDGKDFRTLTGSDPQAQYTIKFQTVPGLEISAIKALLDQYGLELAGGPSETGVYTTSPRQGADLAALSEALMKTPQIVFAAPEQ